MRDSIPGDPVRFTWPGFLAGAQAAMPLMPGIVTFAITFGAASAQKGLTLGQSLAMSAFVCAGASQIMSLELWRDVWTLGAVLTVASVTATVNARFMLQGASLRPWLAEARPLPRAVSIALLFEASWIVAERHRAEGGRDIGVMVGACVLSWAVWIAATLPGYLAGSLVSDPKRYALDLVLPIFFASMAVPLWRGARITGRPWTVAAAVGLATETLVPGYLFIVTGALAGAIAGGLLHERR